MSVVPDADHFGRTRWLTWTPSHTNLTVGNGTVVARFVQLGELVIAFYHLTFGSTSSMGTSPRISMPVVEADSVAAFNQPLGNVWLVDDSSGANNFGFLRHRTTADFEPMVITTGSTYAGATSLTSAVPFTWATADILSFEAVYEAA